MSLGKRRATAPQDSILRPEETAVFCPQAAACRTPCPDFQVLAPALSVRLASHLTSLRAG